jgi:hypothetical protein
MNCEIYRTLLLNNASRKDDHIGACEHAASCADCAEFAREQEHLSSLLVSMREARDSDNTDHGRQAQERTARVETNLLSAFREHSADRAELAKSLSSASVPCAPEENTWQDDDRRTLPQMPQTPRISHLPRWGALAAALILALGVALMSSQLPSIPGLPPPPRISYLPHPPQELIALSTPAKGSEVPSASHGSPEMVTANTVNSAKNLPVDNLELAASSESFVEHSSPPISYARRPNSEARTLVAGDEFIELMPRTPGFLSDGPVVMRVRLPYAAAEYLGAPAGLPAYAQRPDSSGFVQADLLVGSDGTARGIRFVQ